MKLRIFSVMGEALNFGARRMETIIRVAWLPVVLLLLVNMVAVFAYLSAIAGRMITFTDVNNFLSAQQLVASYAVMGWKSNPQAMVAITLGYLVLNGILIASFMAPLIRYSGLGEKPRPGIVNVAFGPDQLRFIISSIFSALFVVVLVLAPMATASYYILKYIIDAMSQTMASFPDPESLHTVELVTLGDQMIAGGATWITDLAIPLAAVAPFAVVLWLVVFLHFHPKNRPHAPEGGNPLLRAIVTLGAIGAVAGGAYWLLRQQVVATMNSALLQGESGAMDFSGTPVNIVLFFAVAAYLLIGYFNLRLYPYPGVAVCRRSLGLGATLRVSRGWNIIRLWVALAFVTIILSVAQFFINTVALNWILSTLTVLYQAVAVSTKLVSSGATAEWVAPLFIWIWNGVKILINIFWTFFSYGVIAGLYGRLYRESEQQEVAGEQPPRKKAIWRRN